MSVRRTANGCVIALLLAFAVIRPGYACQCGVRPTPTESLDKSVLVFAGTVYDIHAIRFESAGVFSYDYQGRMTNITNKDPQGNLLASFDYGYDYDWTSGTYTMLGQRTSVNVTAVGGAFFETGLTKYSYDPMYQLARQDHPNGTYETWTYDATGNRISWRPMNGTTVPYTFFKNGTNTNNATAFATTAPAPQTTPTMRTAM